MMPENEKKKNPANRHQIKQKKNQNEHLVEKWKELTYNKRKEKNDKYHFGEEQMMFHTQLSGNFLEKKINASQWISHIH